MKKTGRQILALYIVRNVKTQSYLNKMTDRHILAPSIKRNHVYHNNYSVHNSVGQANLDPNMSHGDESTFRVKRCIRM